MSHPLVLFCFASLCMCILKVQAGKEHYENDKHNAEFDQTAFLGEEEAARWKKLPTYEVKQKLK